MIELGGLVPWLHTFCPLIRRYQAFPYPTYLFPACARCRCASWLRSTRPSPDIWLRGFLKRASFRMFHRWGKTMPQHGAEKRPRFPRHSLEPKGYWLVQIQRMNSLIHSIWSTYSTTSSYVLRGTCHLTYFWDSLQVDLLVGGFPCVSLSMLTTTPGSVVDTECSSGRGYVGMEKYIKKHKPPMVLLENVATIFSKRKVEGGESP